MTVENRIHDGPVQTLFSENKTIPKTPLSKVKSLLSGTMKLFERIVCM